MKQIGWQMKNRGKVRLSLFLILIQCSFACGNSYSYPEPPFFLPIEADKPGYRVESNFRITKRQTYAFDVSYQFTEDDQEDRARVWRLAGGDYKNSDGKWVDPGAPLQLRLRVVRRLNNGKVATMFDDLISNPRLSSWGSESLNANMITLILEPGDYMVALVNQVGIVDFQSQRVMLSISRAYLGK